MNTEAPIARGTELELIEEELNSLKNQACSFNVRTFEFLHRIGGDEFSGANKPKEETAGVPETQDNALSRIKSSLKDIHKQFTDIELSLNTMEKIS